MCTIHPRSNHKWGDCYANANNHKNDTKPSQLLKQSQKTRTRVQMSKATPWKWKMPTLLVMNHNQLMNMAEAMENDFMNMKEHV
jgi:hypothetical protein